MVANRVATPGRINQLARRLTMRRIASALIALSVLAGVATSVGAQTREDEVRGDFWKEHEYKHPPN